MGDRMNITDIADITISLPEEMLTELPEEEIIYDWGGEILGERE